MDKQNYAIIVAGGKGTRMGSKVRKQFLCIEDKPVICYALESFSTCIDIDSIILVVCPDDVEYVKKEVVEKYKFLKVKDIVSGGSERQHSVYNGLKAINNCNVVLVHDAARPFVTHNIIKNGIKYAEKYGACACGVIPKDTIKIIDSKGFSIDTPDRDKLIAVQTPQCFKYDIIMECHEKLRQEDLRATDDTMVVEYYGYNVYLYEGEYGNIKITTPEDILIAEKIIENSTLDVQ